MTNTTQSNEFSLTSAGGNLTGGVISSMESSPPFFSMVCTKRCFKLILFAVKQSYLVRDWVTKEKLEL
jgi:hypothetical protein